MITKNFTSQNDLAVSKLTLFEWKDTNFIQHTQYVVCIPIFCGKIRTRMYLVCSKLTLFRYLLSYWGFSQVFCSFYKVVQLWLFLLQLPQHILQIRNKKIDSALNLKLGGKFKTHKKVITYSNSFSELLKNVCMKLKLDINQKKTNMYVTNIFERMFSRIL